jgi:hypothetical protein
VYIAFVSCSSHMETSPMPDASNFGVSSEGPYDKQRVLRSCSKACVTNPTAAGRFLVAGGFTGLPLIFPHRTGAVQNQLGRNAPHMSPFGCSPATALAQPGMGTASRAAAVVHQYGHFRCLDGFRFSQRSPAGD